MTSIWKLLDLPRTRDRGDIRRAYARVLKVTNPEDDPEGFQRLRRAYESALAYADSGYDYEDDYADESDDADDELPAAVEWAEPSAGDEGSVFDTLSAEDGTGGNPDRDALRDLRRAERASAAEREAARAVEQEARARARSLWAARSRLTALLEAGDEPPLEALVEALQAVLSHEALDDLGVYTETEAWLSRQIAWGFPRTDPLIDPVIDRFDWRGRARTLGSSYEIERILTREEDLRFLRQIKLRKHPQNPTWRVLAEGPGKSPFDRLRAAWMHKSVRLLLESIEQRHPTIVDTLDDKVVDWWRAYFERPRIGPISMIAALCVPIFVAWVAGASAEKATLAVRGLHALAGFGGALAAIIAVVGGKYLAFDLPRHWWTSRRAWRAPAWAKGGWAALALVSILFAAALPVHIASAVVAGVLAALVVLWCFAVAEHDAHNELATRLGAIAFTNLALVLLWIGMMSEGRSWLAALQVTPLVLAAGLAFARGPVILSESWYEATNGLVRLGATFLACGGAAFLAVLMVASGAQNGVPPMLLAAAAACFSLIQRVPALRADDGERRVRYYGTLALGVTAVLTGGGLELSAPAIAGTILAGSCALSLLITLVGQARGRG